ncbi:MAG: hypothetical protein QW728_07400, partial [Thermoplasmata archaeon]
MTGHHNSYTDSSKSGAEKGKTPSRHSTSRKGIKPMPDAVSRKIVKYDKFTKEYEEMEKRNPDLASLYLLLDSQRALLHSYRYLDYKLNTALAYLALAETYCYEGDLNRSMTIAEKNYENMMQLEPVYPRVVRTLLSIEKQIRFMRETGGESQQEVNSAEELIKRARYFLSAVWSLRGEYMDEESVASTVPEGAEVYCRECASAILPGSILFRCSCGGKYDLKCISRPDPVCSYCDHSLFHKPSEAYSVALLCLESAARILAAVNRKVSQLDKEIAIIVDLLIQCEKFKLDVSKETERYETFFQLVDSGEFEAAAQAVSTLKTDIMNKLYQYCTTQAVPIEKRIASLKKHGVDTSQASGRLEKFRNALTKHQFEEALSLINTVSSEIDKAEHLLQTEVLTAPSMILNQARKAGIDTTKAEADIEKARHLVENKQYREAKEVTDRVISNYLPHIANQLYALLPNYEYDFTIAKQKGISTAKAEEYLGIAKQYLNRGDYHNCIRYLAMSEYEIYREQNILIENFLDNTRKFILSGEGIGVQLLWPKELFETARKRWEDGKLYEALDTAKQAMEETLIAITSSVASQITAVQSVIHESENHGLH